MARAIYVKHARKPGKTDKGEDIAVGQPYYWWKFNFSKTTHKNLTPPTPAQLTQSGFLQDIYGLQEDIAALTVEDIREGDISSITDRIEELRSQCEDSLSNMPEGLQETSASGQTLQSRIDSLEEWQNEIEGVEIPEMEFDEPIPPSDSTSDEEKAKYEEALKEWKEEKEEYDNALEEALNSIQGASYNGE